MSTFGNHGEKGYACGDPYEALEEVDVPSILAFVEPLLDCHDHGSGLLLTS